ncbi:MAG TPA: molybdenum cofactor guanylyltransferase MobA [Paenalcaligenes sp.]|nr:molybdenum cofactor guanylyltransferase MobA [Paenalcaligenes sp.]
MQDLTGAILAGGQARRMQSLSSQAASPLAAQAADQPIDKGLLLLQDRPLVAWQHQCLSPWVSEIIVNANQNDARYAQYGRVVADDADLPAQQGPLMGVLSILRHSRTPWVVIVPVDSPFLPKDYVPRLLSAQSEGQGQLAYYCRAERDYPLCLLIHRETAAGLADYIQNGQRRVIPWLEKIPAGVVEFGAHADEHFANINTPTDFEAARHQLLNRSKA